MAISVCSLLKYFVRGGGTSHFRSVLKVWGKRWIEKLDLHPPHEGSSNGWKKKGKSWREITVAPCVFWFELGRAINIKD